MCKIAIVTPLKDELDNIEDLIDAISHLDCSIEYWVIVENGSTDGSREYLEKISEVKNVKHFIVLNFSLPNDTYELGIKYATVVNIGFNHLKEVNALTQIDYIGILDADCLPPPEYYSKLTDFFETKPKLGISSGQAYYADGSHDGKNLNWPRGNCRLWRIKCFTDSGYIIGPSADALSVCKAEIKGWECLASRKISYLCREVGNKVNYSYYGISAYSRGIPLSYATMKAFNYLIQGKWANSIGYFSGFINAYRQKKSLIDDAEIIEFNKKILWRRMSQWSRG